MELLFEQPLLQVSFVVLSPHCDFLNLIRSDCSIFFCNFFSYCGSGWWNCFRGRGLDYFIDIEARLIERLAAQDRRIAELQHSEFTILGRLNYVSIPLLILQQVVLISANCVHQRLQWKARRPQYHLAVHHLPSQGIMWSVSLATCRSIPGVNIWVDYENYAGVFVKLMRGEMGSLFFTGHCPPHRLLLRPLRPILLVTNVNYYRKLGRFDLCGDHW